MNKRQNALAAMIVAAAGFAAAQAAGQAAKIVPDSFLRGYDPVTVMYGKPVGPSAADSGKTPADGPGEWLRIEPPFPGEYRWLDRRTIQFLPADPWPPLSRFSVLTKEGERSLSTLMAAPSSVSPLPGSADLEPFDGIDLNFSTRIDPLALARSLRVEIRDLPGVDEAGATWISAPALSVRELEGERSRGYRGYRLSLREPLPYGKRLILHLRLSLDESVRDSLVSYRFDTKADFRIVAMGAESARLPVSPSGSAYEKDQAIDCGTGRSSLFLEFSESLQAPEVEAMKRLLRFEPAVRNLACEASAERLYLSFDADRDRQYKLSVAWQGLRSRTGRELARFAPSSFYFFYRQAQSFLTWRQSNSIIERYGPQYLPFEGRGISRLDLRIYKIDPENLDFWPFPAEPIAIGENSRPPMPGEEPGPRGDMSQHIRLLGSPVVSKLVDLPTSPQSGRTVFGLDVKTELAAAFGAEAPGHYLVGVRTIDAGDTRSYARITVTDLCLSSVEEEDAVVFVVSSLRTGAALPGARLRVDSLENGSAKELFSGITDAEGRFRYEHRQGLSAMPYRVVVSMEGDSLIVDPRYPPPAFANNHWSAGSRSWLEWLAYEPRALRHKAISMAFLLTERPVYRPEEAVHIIGWARDRVDGKIVEYSGRDLVVVVIYEGGKEWRFPAPLSGLGRFHVLFDEKESPTGNFRAELRTKEGSAVLARAEFKKESYRVPTFKVDISGPSRVPVDKPFTLDLVADYYAGGRVVGESVRWEITQYPYSVSSPAFPGYLFSTDIRFGGGEGYGGSEARESVLDEEGSCSIEINPAAEQDGRARRYVVEATVMGADSQTVTQAKQVLALPSFCLGLKVDRLAQGGKPLAAGLLALDYAELPLPGMKVGLRLYQREWHSYIADTDFTTGEPKYVTDVVDKLVEERSVETLDGPLPLSFKAQAAGVYVIEAFAQDALGRRVSVKADIFYQGGGPVSWERQKSGLFEASPDKSSYRPGDRAKLLIKSPFEEGWALIVVEAPTRNDYSFVRVKEGRAIHEIEITGDMAPGIPVSVLLERGRVPGTVSLALGARADLGRPASLGASAWLKVQPTANQAFVSLSHEEKGRPGNPLDISIRLADPEGRPLDGEVALWLVDKAVLSLGQEKPIEPLPSFIRQAASFLRILDSRNQVLGALPPEEVPGGDGSLDALAMLELMSRTTVRKNFQTVPYFNPAIKVVGGSATIRVDLPDNLTDFAIRAVAVSGFSRLGSAKSSVSVRLPVLVQSAMPRFVRPGDSFVAGGLARVVEGPGGPGSAALSVEGLTIDGVVGSKTGAAITLDASRALRLSYPLSVPPSLDPISTPTVKASLFVRREADGVSDAFALDLPVRDDVTPTRLQSLDKLEGIATLALPDPPGGSRPGGRSRSIVVARDERLLKLLLGLEYLSSYPHGCLEQRISRLLPAVELRGLVEAAGLPSRPPSALEAAELKAYMASCQDGDGLFGFWPGSMGSVSLTAYVLEFLSALAETGAAIDTAARDRAMRGLEAALRSDNRRLVPSYAGYERVEALAALERAGRFDRAYADDLLGLSPSLGAYSQARLYIALSRRSRGDGLKERALLKRLESMVVTRKEGDRIVFDSLQDKASRYGGPVLSSETKTLAALYEAIRRGDPKSSLTGLLLDAILARAGKEGWGSTQDNVAAMRALKTFVEPDSKKGKDIVLELKSKGKVDRLSTGGRSIASFTVPAGDSLTLQVKSGLDKGASLWVLSRLDYRQAARGCLAPAANAGFAVSREFLAVEAGGGTRPIQPEGSLVRVRKEDVVEERVTVVNFEDRDYVAISVPLGAGFEPLNPNLATSPKEAAPAGALTLKPTYSLYLDDAVYFYYDHLPRGSYDFYFRVRASFVGSFTATSASAELMYDLPKNGRSRGYEISVEE